MMYVYLIIMHLHCFVWTIDIRKSYFGDMLQTSLLKKGKNVIGA